MWRGLARLATWENALRLGGLLGVAYEAVSRSTADPGLLVVFAAMLGLPEMIGIDRKRRNGTS